MRTPSDVYEDKAKYNLRKQGRRTLFSSLMGGQPVQRRREIVAESKHLIINPGMRLVWDDELNRMVWR